MSVLAPLPGDGRLLRNDRWIVFTAVPAADLMDELLDAADVFKGLAEYIVKRSFDVVDVVAIDTERRAVMLFGAITLSTSRGMTISATGTSTWVEVSIADDDVVLCRLAPGSDPLLDLDPGLDLKAGRVPAGGFVWSVASVPTTVAVVAALLDGADPEPPSGTPPAPPDPAVELDEASYLRDPLADPSGFDLDRLGADPSVLRPDPADEPAPAPTTSAATTSGGEPPPVADLAPATMAPMFGVDQPAEAPPPVSPSPVRPPPGLSQRSASDPRSPQAALPATDNAGPGPGSPHPPVRPETASPAGTGSSAPQTPPAGAETLLPELPSLPPAISPPRPATGALAVRLHFDDGQTAEVTTGVYVGRNPTRSGLPDGFAAVTIRGEQVSRRHWELIVRGRSIVVNDLGSAAGTTVDRPGQGIISAVGGIEVRSGDTIWFADRWAAIE